MREHIFCVLCFTIISLSLWHLIIAQCPPIDPPCRCAPSIYEPISIICENAGGLANALTAIDEARNHVIDSLSIVDTSIEVLPANAFRDFFILRLVLNRNHLGEIELDVFSGPSVKSLVELDLSDNNLQQIPQNGIQSLLNLRKLYLNRNRIGQRIQQDAFNGYASRELLIKLELASNHLTDSHLSGSVFRSLRNLRELSLETNELTRVPSQALESQRNTLVNLNLGSNQIRDIPAGALNFPLLNSLSLEFNGITAISAEEIQGVPHLQYLYLTGNKFSTWQPDTFRYLRELRTLGIGETPIKIIPTNALIYTPNLMRLEMSEAAVDTIEVGAFQRAPFLQAIVLNKNRLTRIYSGVFAGLFELYSIDLQGNRINFVESEAFANLPGLRHLDISFNQLETMPSNVFENSFDPLPDDRRVIYTCANPWQCDSRLEWFRQLLRTNLDIDIDKPGCMATCALSANYCPVEGTRLRAPDVCPVSNNTLPLRGMTPPLVGWVILAVILTILAISICLMALIRYGISHKRKKEKNREIEDQRRVVSSVASMHEDRVMNTNIINQQHDRDHDRLDLDLPIARTLDDVHNNYM